jgi:polyisoprenoid-binding protein YceI
MKKAILFFSFIAMTASVMAQKVVTTSAVLTFDATTPKDNMPKAENKTGIASLDKTTGAVMVEAAVTNFSFANPMMHDHFNGEKWINSAVNPKFTFSGKIDKLSEVKFKKNGSYKTTVSGNLSIKGVSKPVTIPVTFVVKGGTVTSSSAFTIKVADYGITSQYIESGKVSAEPKLTVSASFK